jgi:hypothetical protein
MAVLRIFVVTAIVIAASAGPDLISKGTVQWKQLAQELSNKCSTQAGICFVPALPIGSACSCGQYPGVIVP